MIRSVLLAVALAGCEFPGETEQRFRAERAEAALSKAVKCADEATLLASTIGSPREKRCSNPAHVIQAAPISAGTEEVGAMIVCRCPRADGGAP